MNEEYKNEIDVYRPSLEEVKNLFLYEKLASRLINTSVDDIQEEEIQNFYALSFKEHKIYFELVPLCSTRYKGIYEIHIAIPKDSIRWGRLLAMLVMYWLFNIYDVNAKGIYTKSNYKSMSNFVSNIGFTPIKKDAEYDHFFYLNVA